ncbi:MAG: arsenate reductase ArsC [Stellaceae bacterium]
MPSRPYNVLFLCTGNSARSIMGEVLLNHWGKGRFRGFSAGSQPKGDVHPLTLELLRGMKLPTEGLRSKSWSEFAKPDAPKMDFVFTVCDQAAAETCPIWPGQPMTAHWGVPDPASVKGSDAEKTTAFRDAFSRLDARIKLFMSLPFDKLERMALKREVDKIGLLRSDAAEDAAS